MKHTILHPTCALRLVICACLALGSCDSASPAASGPPSAQDLFKRELCTACHGQDRQGSWMGPPLVQLGQHWERAALIDFLRAPSKFTARDPRLAALSRQFRAPMVDRPALGRADRASLADWLLGGSGKPKAARDDG